MIDKYVLPMINFVIVYTFTFLLHLAGLIADLDFALILGTLIVIYFDLRAGIRNVEDHLRNRRHR